MPGGSLWRGRGDTAIAREMLAFMWAIAKKVQIGKYSQSLLDAG
jgi:hypothetical protein